MSTVSQTSLIDWLGLEKGSGHVSLTVVDDLDWSDEQVHLVLLEAKLNAYLAFIESGEVHDRVKDELRRDVARSTPIKVEVIFRFEPSRRAVEFIEYATRTFAEAGVQLTTSIRE